jgi:hypothetical protein
MKFIAKRDFYRVPALKRLTIIDACKGATKDAPHPNHIHMGAIFEMAPTAKDESELQLGNDPEKQLVAQLRYAGCIGDAADPKVVPRVEQDVKDAARDKAQRIEAEKDGDNSNLVATLTKFFSKAADAK